MIHPYRHRYLPSRAPSVRIPGKATTRSGARSHRGPSPAWLRGRIGHRSSGVLLGTEAKWAKATCWGRSMSSFSRRIPALIQVVIVEKFDRRKGNRPLPLVRANETGRAPAHQPAPHRHQLLVRVVNRPSPDKRLAHLQERAERLAPHVRSLCNRLHAVL
jgi:hypothetical protein